MVRGLPLLFIGAGMLESQSVAQQVLRTHDGMDAFDQLSRSARIEDLDGDAVDDYLLAAPAADPGGVVFAMSGAGGGELWRIQGTVAHGSLGAALADAGDFDGDGVPDVVVGGPGAGPGFADVYSGATLALLVRSVGSWDVGVDYGRNVAALGDVDQDGFDDVAIGGDTTIARILGGPDGHVIRSHNGPPYGAAVAGLGDVSGDGVPDY